MMKKQNIYLLNGFFLSSIVLGGAVPAFALGLADPLAYQGNGSRVIDTGTPDWPLPVTIVAEHLSNSINDATAVSCSGNNISASASTSDYRFGGSVSATGHDTAWRSGGYFQDELYFESDGGSASIEFVFDVSVSAQLYNVEGRTDLSASMSYWDGISYTTVGYEPVLSLSGSQSSFTGDWRFAFSLDECESGTYLPYTIGIWGDVVNGALSWNGELVDVIVTDGEGNNLDPESYLLRSNNGSLAFAGFENPPSDIPVPATAWLFGLGFAGLAGLRRRK